MVTIGWTATTASGDIEAPITAVPPPLSVPTVGSPEFMAWATGQAGGAMPVAKTCATCRRNFDGTCGEASCDAFDRWIDKDAPKTEKEIAQELAELEKSVVYRARLLKHALIATKLFEDTYYKKESSTEISADRKKLYALVKACNLPDEFTELIEHITKTKRPPGYDTNLTYASYCVVVPLSNTNGHNYRLDVPVMSWPHSQDVFMRVNGDKGNHLHRILDGVRPATEKEITWFVDNLEIRGLIAILNYIKAGD